MVNADASLADELNNFYACFKAAAHNVNSVSSANSAIGSMHAENARKENVFIISEHDVRQAFRRVNTRKAAGPDGITGRVLKACANQLAPVFTEIFNLSLEQSMIPTCFKQSTIVPVHKKSQPACLNNYRPVALTSVMMKCFERLIRDFITSSLPDILDPLQFAYRPNCSTEDTIAHLHHTALSHLDSRKGNYFADDTAVVGLISNNDETAYLEEIKNLETWCQDNNLFLNVSKTKELIVGFSTKQERNYQSLIINGTPVERVDIFLYLGVHIMQDLSWSCHVNTLVKKAWQHLYHLRCLKDFKLPSKVLKMFYTCTTESILTGSITAWFGNITKQDRQALRDLSQAYHLCRAP
ncbi:hypothetical protein QTP70_002839 [Hemibagrus guttatus]|uniref:Alkylated DNA repair protein AlkB homologue 8 N-terminal domain-containing protein n=1 Tax=Hemibagrus guttatus TaxID=175788 RepID=A0AAE0QRY6_9TELE|nr:hypothetical protein QTP70_002839 [Hemibagrus guttatus]KAK3560588.1 hypothetical protein QTP86_010923 [Hemibagrus guttatus]